MHPIPGEGDLIRVSKLKLLVFITSILLTGFTYAGEWLELKPTDLRQIEIAQEGALSFASEGVYFVHNGEYPTTLSCSKKAYVVITDQKLIDRSYSGALFAIASGKTLKFYVDGCDNGYIHAKIFMLLP